MVTVPAVPPLPMAAMSPFTHMKSLAPSDQLAFVVVFQFPLPSLGAVGLVGLASQVSVCPIDDAVQNAETTGTAANTMNLPFRCERVPLRILMITLLARDRDSPKDMSLWMGI